MPSRLLVLGHSGFIGRALCESVRRHHPAVDVAGLSLEVSDLSSPPAVSVLMSALEGADTVAVLAGVKKQRGDTMEAFNQNMAIAAHVCEALHARPAPRVMFFSSAEVYGEHTNDTQISERTPVRPTSYYGVAKFASEGLFRKMAEATGTSLVIARPPLVFGPGEPQASYGPSGFVRAAVRREAITMWGDGREKREFLYLTDLVEAARQLFFSRAHGVVNISSGRHCAFQDILNALSDVLGEELQINSRARTKPSVNQGYVNDRLRSLLPGLAFTPLERALEEMIAAERLAVAP